MSQRISVKREKGDSAFGTPGNQSLAKKPGFLEK
jgi:hypothetical protein